MAIELLAGIEGVVSISLDQLITLWDAGFPGARILQDRRLVNAAHVRLLSESRGH
jgi:hypothetical protein